MAAETLRELAPDAIEVGLLEGVFEVEDAVVDDAGPIDQDRDHARAVQPDEFEPLDQRVHDLRIRLAEPVCKCALPHRD